MQFPRLILADEERKEVVPPTVILASALRQRGYPLRLFVAGIDERRLRLLQLLCGLDVTALDTRLCATPHNLRALFSAAASSDSLNLILAPLGEDEGEDDIRLDRHTARLSELLECDILPVLYGGTSAALAARKAFNLKKKLEKCRGANVRALLFDSVLNPKEYQLLEIEVGRHFPWICLGYIPRHIERKAPSLLQLCAQKPNSSLAIALRTASAQLNVIEGQIEWQVFSSLARLAHDWNAACAQFETLSQVRVAILRHEALSLGGNNLELLLRRLGCEIVDVSVSDEIIPPDVHALYVPHGLGYLSLVPLSANAPLRRDMGNLVFGKGLFAEGGGSLILGESIELPTGREVKGLGLMPVKGSFAESSGRREYIEVRGETDGSFLRKDEAMRGYWPEGISAKKSSAADRAEWGVWDVEDQARLSDDGFVIGRSVATQMRLEPWSAPDVFCRWLKSL